jgi:hypothetical protein
VGFSLAQIKQISDLSILASKVKRQKYRGVDGRKVTDHKTLFSLPYSKWPLGMTQEEREKMRRECERSTGRR